MAKENNGATNADQSTADKMSSRIATVAAVAVGVALIEVELIPGMLIGVAAMLAPKFLPGLGKTMRPLMKTAMRAGYAAIEKTKEVLAEASEQFQDVAAEARHEQDVAEAETPRKPSAARKRKRPAAA